MTEITDMKNKLDITSEGNDIIETEMERQFLELLKKIPKDELWRVEEMVNRIYKEEQGGK